VASGELASLRRRFCSTRETPASSRHSPMAAAVVAAVLPEGAAGEKPGRRMCVAVVWSD